MSDHVYLDYNATAPLRPEALAAFSSLATQANNPSSVHAFGRAARKALEQARSEIAELLNLDRSGLFFTSGGTESNNTLLKAFGDKPLLLSAGEHDAVLKAAPHAVRIPLQTNGQVDLDALSALLKEQSPALVSVMTANNETGVLQPIEQVAELVHSAGALLHCDAVQSFGKETLDVEALGIDALSLSAHKLGGPQGVGALYLKSGLEIPPLLVGGGQEQRRRAGTENVAGISAFAAAARAAYSEAGRYEELRRWRDQLEERLLAFAKDVRILGRSAPRLANTSSIVMPGVRAETQVIHLDLQGVAISAGSACSSGKVTTSHVLSAMGEPDYVAGSTIRLSLGWASKQSDLDRFYEAWTALYHRQRVKRSA